MEKIREEKIDVTFVGDKDVEREIISFKDWQNSSAGNTLQQRNKGRYKDSDSEEDGLYEETDKKEKPTELFEAGDVPGQQIFGFQTPKRKGILTPRTPQSNKVNRTPHTVSHEVATAKTPYSLRRRLKKKIASTAQHYANGDMSDSDFSVSDGEYKPSDSESSSSSDAEDSQESQMKEEPNKQQRKSRRLQEMEYILEADEFFSNQKSVTSDHTLNRLRQPRLEEEQLQQLLRNMTLSHQKSIRSLYTEHAELFPKWMFALREQYNIIVYGLGSKRHILQQFHSRMLQDHLVLEVNGFFPSLTIKEIVDSIADDLLELSHHPTGLLECLEAIETELSDELFIIIHNLDGPMLRSDKSQDILSRLARMHYVHLLVSIDHINAPLIWDHVRLSRYNFLWFDVTTLQPYDGETQFESSLLVQQSGSLALSSLSNVFNSLTVNARNIFIIMVRHQLSNRKDSTYLGMPFRELYWSAREALLVSSDLALRAQLTEFLDHRLVRQRRSHDGSELLQVPIDSVVLQRFLEQVEGDT